MATQFIGMRDGVEAYQLSPAHRAILDQAFVTEGMGSLGLNRLWSRVRERPNRPTFRQTRWYHRTQATPQIWRPQRKPPSTVKVVSKRPWTRVQIDGLAVPVKNPRKDPFARRTPPPPPGPVGRRLRSYMAFNIVDTFSRKAYSRVYARNNLTNAADAMLRALADVSQAYGLDQQPPNQRLPRNMLVNADGQFNSPLFRNPVRTAYPQVTFLTNPPHTPNAAAFVERLNGTLVNQFGRMKQQLIRRDTGARWPATGAAYTALWARGIALYNDTVHSSTGRKPDDLSVLTDAQAAAFLAARAARIKVPRSRAALPTKARQAELMPVGSLHRLVNAQLQKLELRGFQKWSEPRYTLEVYEVTREAQTSSLQNRKVFVREYKQGYGPDYTDAQVNAMTGPQVRAALERRRQPARFPKGSDGPDAAGVNRKNNRAENVGAMRERLKAKLRQERNDVQRSFAGDGELPSSFALQQLSPVGWPVEWAGDAGRTYPP